MIRIKRGVTRIVFLVGPYAIKVPKPKIWRHFLLGLLSNMNEKSQWDISLITGKSEYLCPVVWMCFGGWVLVMKRCEPYPSLKEDWDLFKEKIIKHLEVHEGDDKPTNYGIFEGRLVKLDYGELT